jgi:endonuclease/exonuclease/phosphatase family metal-dependent hydrolase
VETVRLLTLNLWGEQTPLARRMELIADGIQSLAPDVIALQEVRAIEGALRNQAETLAARFGFHWVWAPATSWGGGDEGLAILSSLPIAHHAWRELPHGTAMERRLVLGAAITTPQGELGVFTTHLNYRLTDGAKREDQVAAIDAFAADWAAERRSRLPRLLAGDFNAVPDADEIRFLRGKHTHGGHRTYWQDAWERLQPDEPGYTWARANPNTERLHWLDRDRRIDYIFVSPLTRDGRGEVLGCGIAFDAPDEDSCYASDHFGLYAEIRLAAKTDAAG